MEQSLGTLLRQHRERRGLSLEGIAAQTKIKMSLLEGLERDDVSQWPPGIYRRAYVRTYAAAVGYDPDAASREFLARHPELEAPIVLPSAQPRGLRGVLGSALGSFLKQPTVEATSGREAAVIDRPSPAARRIAAEVPASPPQAVPEPVAEPAREARVPEARVPDFVAAAAVCTELGRVEDAERLPAILRDAANVLGARGLIVWLWDAVGEELRPAIVHGYASNVRSRLRGVRADADNVTAAAFRSAATHVSGAALAIPLLTASGCAGVLALELAGSREPAGPVLALATIFAAMLAQLSGASQTSIESDEVSSSPALEAHPG